MQPSEIQEMLYSFPYHCLPRDEDGVWQVSRCLHWGYEYLAILNTVLELIRRYPVTRLIDFGCGDGRLIRELASENPNLEIIGVDISQRALAFARAFNYGNPKVHLFPEIHAIDQSLLPVDALVAMEVFEHIPPVQLGQIVRQLHSLLHASGILVVSVPTTNIPLNRKHHQHFSLDSLCSLMDGFFELEEYRYIHRVGLVWELLRRMVANRIFTANNKVWLKLMTWLYRRFVLEADEKTGSHLVGVFKRAGNI